MITPTSNSMFSISKFLFSVILIASALSVKSQTINAPKPYSQYRMSNGLIFISGQIGVSPLTGKLVDSSFDMEVAEVMQHIKDILKRSHSDFSAVVNMTVYLKDINRYSEFNEVYIKYFNAPFPARSCVAVKDLANGAHIEIAAIAAVKKD